MLFNSIDFAIFLPIVFVLYWHVSKSNLKIQNILIVVASYIFYGWWDYRFLSLILFSTLVDFGVGLLLKKTANLKYRKVLLWTSIAVNLGFLGFFKYYNFFLDNFINAFTFFGSTISANSLNIILPVGISFYTFQTLSYSIDVYNRKLEPTEDFIAFSAFVSFFPQLVAGPIERATNLLPQFFKKREFSYPIAVDGMRQILWGFFKKLVIADNCAEYANTIFNNSDTNSGSTLLLGALYFTFQIYGDFSGYSDIAIGSSKLFGFNLKQNFAFPYFSRDIAEFWRRWHISLSTWFRDYVYIPLGGSKGNRLNQIRNVFIIFIVSGFWHGANWTFIAWGALNALYFIPLLLLNKNRNNIGIIGRNDTRPSIREISGMLTTFMLTVFAWIFFRADSIQHAVNYISGIFSLNFFSKPNYIPYSIAFFLAILLIIEWKGRENEHALQTFLVGRPNMLRWTFYIFICILIFIFSGQQQEFIYFQF